MIVSDLRNRLQFSLITDSQEIQAVLHSIGVPPAAFGCLFVETIDGDYGEVYGCYSNIPYLHYELEKIKQEGGRYA